MLHKDIVIARAVSDWICLGPWSMDAGQLQLTIEALETYIKVSQKALDDARTLWNHSRSPQAIADVLRHEEIIAKADAALISLRDCLAEQS